MREWSTHPRFATALLVLGLSAGCASNDEKAAEAAASASAALQSGNVPLARREIGRALALRDDVSDYWLQLAQIAVQGRDLAAAFDAYENVITLDRSNVEALTLICQIALTAKAPQRAERYADELAVLRPTDVLPKTVKAALALSRSDKVTARKLLDEVLAASPGDVQALLVDSRLRMADDDFAGAAGAVEKSLAAPGDPTYRLTTLKDLYQRAGDIDNYERTVARLARANPDSPSAQIDYAETLYGSGDRDAAFAVSRRVLEVHPTDVAASASVLNLWLAQGRAAMPVDAIAAAGDMPLEARATFGQYANEIGRPDLALTLLSGDAPAGAPSPANSDAKTAFAYASAMSGNIALANAVLAQVLAVDPDQPDALLARARLRAWSGDLAGAVADARQVSTGDRDNATARLTLAELLLRQNQATLAETVLREGVARQTGDLRPTQRLAALLRSQGRGSDAQAMLADFARNNPTSRPAKQLAARS